MALIRILPNGTTSGNPNSSGNPEPPKRSTTGGWNFQVSRRLRKWFYSIPVDSLNGFGFAFTLTLRDCPPDFKDWSKLRDNYVKRLQYDGCIRLQWLTEWQERGVPHLHGIAYFDKPINPDSLIKHWLSLTANKYGSSPKAQNVKPITSLRGWLEYLAKHSTRSAIHYQRSPENIPEGWTKTGRMWGYSGDWDVREPMSFLICQEGFYAYRRISNSLRHSIVRSRLYKARQDVLDHYSKYPFVLQKTFEHSLSQTHLNAIFTFSSLRRAYRALLLEFTRSKRALKNNDKDLSHYKGTSNWIDLDASIKIVLFLTSSGYKVEQTD